MECGLCNYWPQMYKTSELSVNGMENYLKKVHHDSLLMNAFISLQMYSPKEVLMVAIQETVLSCDILSNNF